jgi:hypothetical protein
MVPFGSNKIMNWCKQPRIGEYVHSDNDHARRLIVVMVWLWLVKHRQRDCNASMRTCH